MSRTFRLDSSESSGERRRLRLPGSRRRPLPLHDAGTVDTTTTRTAARKMADGLVGGAYDALSACLVDQAGFDAVWASGFCISASRLLPDRSVLTADELVTQVAAMTRAVDIPVLVDCDEGYGDVTTTYELVRNLADCGAGGVCIEDNAYPKYNSFCDTSRRRLAEVDDFVEKLHAAQAAAPNLVVMARTESLIAGESMDAAMARATRYADAGADYVVIHSRFTRLGEFRRLARAWPSAVPLAVIPTLCQDATWDDLRALGYGLVIYANQSMRASVHAQETVLRSIRQSHTTSQSLSSMEHLFALTDLSADPVVADAE